ncbi:MAG: choice-of-anchor D domain-containing protein [Proteobacteria bacterium]|nr:choice-of-anchor D domain-containing protein [Pseudomonadota bacterium]
MRSGVRHVVPAIFALVLLVQSISAAPPAFVIAEPEAHDYGSVRVGDLSEAVRITVTNTGERSARINSIRFAERLNFSIVEESSTCLVGLKLPGGGSTCVIDIVFGPVESGDLADTLTVGTNRGRPKISLSGKGLAPDALIEPASRDFLDQPIGKPSAAQAFKVTNTGDADLHVSAIDIAGPDSSDFALMSETCVGEAIAPLDSCNFEIVFTPRGLGPRSAQAEISDDAVSGSPQIVPLSGNGIADVSLAPSAHDFGDRPIGERSPAHEFVVTNGGAADVNISLVAVSGDHPADFAIQADGCTGESLAPEETCSIIADFSPAGVGGRSALLEVHHDSAAASPLVSALLGTGTSGDVSVTPAAVSFPDQLILTGSAPVTVTVENTGAVDLTVGALAIGGVDASEFGLESDLCSGQTLGPAVTCTFDAVFAPATVGVKDARVDIPNDVIVVTVGLTGEGVAPDAAAEPGELAFGDQPVGRPSPLLTVTVTNTGGADLNVSSVSIAGADAADFAISRNTCLGAPVAPAGTCTFAVGFTPGSLGEKEAQAEVADDAISGSPQIVSLSGNGISDVNLNPADYDFGEQLVGTSDTRTFVLTNVGGADLTIATIVPAGPSAADYTIPDAGDGCSGATVAQDDTCSFDVEFSPGGVGGRQAHVEITSDAASGSPDTLPLFGTGIASDVAIFPMNIDFGDQLVGSESDPQEITATNTGEAVLNVDTVMLAGADAGDFEISIDGCTGSSVMPSLSCSVTVVFRPLLVGDKTAQVEIYDDAISGSPQTVPLGGKGVPPMPSVRLVPVSVNFGSQEVGTTGPPQLITLTNSGMAPLNITAITASGEFSQTNDCPAALAAGADCTISASFSPSSEGAKAGAIEVTDDAADSPQRVALSGTGSAAPVSANLSITKAVAPDTAQCRIDVTCTIVVTNTGSSAAENVVVMDTMPGGLAFVSASASQGACESGEASCSLGRLNASDSASVAVVVRPTAAGTITNTATASSDSISQPVSASAVLTVNDVDCGGDGGGGGCSLARETPRPRDRVLSGILASMAAIGALLALHFARARGRSNP